MVVIDYHLLCVYSKDGDLGMKIKLIRIIMLLSLVGLIVYVATHYVK